MKKLIAVILALIFTLSFTACGGSSDASISYGDAYVVDWAVADNWQEGEKYRAFYFNSDGTGRYVVYTEHHSSTDSSEDYVSSSTIEFVWETASDGSVYLFETKNTKNEDDTSGWTYSLSTSPLYFSENFVVCGDDDAGRFVREGSELFDILKAANAEAKAKK